MYPRGTMGQDEERTSITIEDYLQSIYSLETEGEKVISARLARWIRACLIGWIASRRARLI